MDSVEWQEKFQSILGDIEQRVRVQTGGQTRFADWLSHEALTNGTTRDRAIGWRTLEILIERDRRRSQGAFDFTLPADELEEKTDSQIRAAAELFLALEYKLPYYFGPSRLASLASSNMEQFLWLAGDEFEEVVSAVITRRAPNLSASRQDHITRSASNTLWQEISRAGRGLRFLDPAESFLEQRLGRLTSFDETPANRFQFFEIVGAAHYPTPCRQYPSQSFTGPGAADGSRARFI